MAGGIPAGRLNIEIVAEIARLQSDLDKAKRLVNAASGDIARSARAANDNLSAIGKGAGAGVLQFSRDVSKLKASLDPAWSALQRYKNEVALLQRALSEGAITHQQFVAQMRGAVATYKSTGDGLDRQTNSAVKNRMAMQGASYQLQDFFTQVSMGANPINAFAVQGAQLAGQFSDIEGKAGNVARFFMGPWGLAITAGMMLFGPFIAKLFEGNHALDDAVDKLRKDAAETELTAKAKDRFRLSQEGVSAAIREQTEALKKVAEAEKSAAEQANIAAKREYERQIGIRSTTVALLEKAKAEADAANATSFGAGGGAGAGMAQSVYAGRVSELTESLKTAEAALSAARANVQNSRIEIAAEEAKRLTDPMERIRKRYDTQVAAAKDAVRAEIKAGAELSHARRIALAEQIAAIERARQAAIKAEQDKQSAAKQTFDQMGRNVDLAEGRRIAESVGGRVTSGLRSSETQKGLYEKYQAYKAGNGPWAALAAKPGTSNHELGQAIDVAKGNGVTLAKLVAAYKAAGVRVTEALDEGSHYHIAWKKVGAAAKQQSAEAAEAAREAKRAKEEYLKLLDVAQDWGDLDSRMRSSREEGARASKQIQVDAGNLLGYEIGSDQDPFVQMQRAQQGVADYERAVETGMDKATEAVVEHASAWDSLGSALDQIAPGLGDVAALLKGLETGNFTSVRGKVGGVLSLMSMGAGEDGWKAVTKKLDSIFGGSGSFAATMTGLIRGAGIGSAASQLVGGSGGAGSMLGGAIGGKLGEKLGETMAKSTSKLLKGLGDFAGPLGSILGGVAGDLLGGIIKGKPGLGATVVTGVTGSDPGAWGRKGQLENATTVGGAVQDQLNNIITALGGVAGAFKVGLGAVEWQGATHYRVSADGRYDVGSQSYGDNNGGDMIFSGTDANEAVRVAVLNAIEDGAIKGITDAELKLLKAGGDLQTALSKALTFKSVFDDLSEATDPTGFALDQLTKKFDGLRNVFTEAGAGADEMAKLEQLLAIQRKQIIDEAAKKELDSLNERRALEVRLLEAQGKSAEALALARVIELSGTKDSLKALQEQVYAAEDAVKAAGQLTDAWKSVGDSIADEIRRIRGLTDAGTSKGFASLQGEFNAALQAARGGNIDSAKMLPGLSKDLLDAAALVATSRQELDRVRAQTALALESLASSSAATSMQDATALVAAAATTQTSTAAPTNDGLLAELRSLREEVAQLRKENNAGHAQTAGNTGKSTRILEEVTAPNGGQAVSIAGAAA